MAVQLASLTYTGVHIIDAMECSFLVSRRVLPGMDYCSAIVSSVSPVRHYERILSVSEELIASIDRIESLCGASLDITVAHHVVTAAQT